jgi:hypothetical protein
MSRRHVFVAEWMAAAGLDLIGDHCDLDSEGNTDPLPREEFLARAGRAEGLVVFVSGIVDREVVEGSPGLKFVNSFGKDHDSFDVAACTENAVLVGDQPGGPGLVGGRPRHRPDPDALPQHHGGGQARAVRPVSGLAHDRTAGPRVGVPIATAQL